MREDESPPPLPPPLTAPVPPPLPSVARPWGVWATLGLSLLVFGGTVGAQSLALAVYLPVMKLTGRSVELSEIASSGFFLALATCLSTPVTVGLTVLFAWLRRGVPLREYLRLKFPTRAEAARWGLVLLLFMVISDSITLAVGRPLVPQVMVEFYKSSLFPPLIWLAMVVGAPLGEEILFRGFMFEGLLHSRIGARGAVLLTSLVWASIHLQYDFAGVAEIFACGLLLGWVRLRTGSLYLTMLLHATMNLIAALQTVWLIRTGQG